MVFIPLPGAADVPGESVDVREPLDMTQGNFPCSPEIVNRPSMARAVLVISW